VSGILRKIKLGTFASGLSLGSETFKKKVALRLLAMRGLPAKLVQIKSFTSSSESNLWKDAITEINSIPTSQFEESIRLYYPSLFSRLTFDKKERAYPASIGQVQKAMLDGEREVAIKLRHQNIKEQVLDDVGMISLVGKLFSMLQDGFSLDDYRSMLSDRLTKELDFESEANIQNRFKSFFSEYAGIKIPEALPTLTTENILCQEWVDAIPAETFLSQCSEQEKIEFSDLISLFYFDSIFELGLIHTDPNPGNFGVILHEKGIKLVIFDFGSVYQISEKEKFALWGLIQNQIHPKWNDMYFLSQLGFDVETLSKIEGKLSAYLSVLLEPFLEQSRYDLSRWNRKERCNDIMGPNKFQFMISAPANFFSMMRAFQGLFHWCHKSSGDIWLYPKISKKSFEMNSQWNDLIISVPEKRKSIATSLKIDVWRGEEKTVSLTLPRAAVEQLEHLIEPALMEKIMEKGFDIRAIQKQSRIGAYHPQELISWKEDEKKIRIYLE